MALLTHIHPQLHVQLHACVILSIADVFLSRQFHIFALPIPNGVSVCFTSSGSAVSYLCQEGSSPVMPCRSKSSIIVCYFRLPFYLLIIFIVIIIYPFFPLYTCTTGNGCKFYCRDDGTGTVTIYILGEGIESQKHSFKYRV